MNFNELDPILQGLVRLHAESEMSASFANRQREIELQRTRIKNAIDLFKETVLVAVPELKEYGAVTSQMDEEGKRILVGIGPFIFTREDGYIYILSDCPRCGKSLSIRTWAGYGSEGNRDGFVEAMYKSLDLPQPQQGISAVCDKCTEEMKMAHLQPDGAPVPVEDAEVLQAQTILNAFRTILGALGVAWEEQ